MNASKKKMLAVIAMGDDGTTYRIERRSRSFPGDDEEHSSFYCCLPDGNPVWWLGNGRFQLHSGEIVKIVGSHYSQT